ncbi:MAG: aminoglycoside phosphotransferase family protein [Desulfobulbaceae bacterium]|nr:aminoglycoside phosphotransferase family protein [Desulfobulbaceae bacterium]
MQPVTIKPGGWLEYQDPLHAYLKNAVLPRLGVEVPQPDIESICLNKQQSVFRYRERKTLTSVVGKFFGSRCPRPGSDPRKDLSREFRNLVAIRKRGLDKDPHRVVRPLGKNEKINCLLVEEFIRGHDLDYYIAKAAYEGQNQALMEKLEILADFLARLHGLPTGRGHMGFSKIYSYFRSIVQSLLIGEVIDPHMGREFYRLCHDWGQNRALRKEKPVWVHGDATTTNFIFHREEGITAIDLELMRVTDRVYDIGFLTAEIKHHFAWRILQAEAAEPFIRNFLWAYCQKLRDPESAFRDITYRNRFFMSLGELRIARNRWLPWGHRKWLAEEALRCLQP